MNIIKLIEKYNAAVPRYTSYPPANHFTEDYNGNEYRQDVLKSNEDKPENISIYLHIPFCKKRCFYCGCNMCPMGDHDQVRNYISAVKKEMEMVFNLLDKKRKISQIHYGGGTPNSIPAEYLKELNEYIFSNFNLIEEPEIAIECNPAYLDFKYIDELRKSGFNRFSLGVQDFDNRVLKQINREPSALPVDEFIGYIKEGNPGTAVNLDFIYGLPGQSVESFLNSIQQAIEIKPDRLVTFSYAHVPWVHKHQKILEKKGLPESSDKVQMFLQSRLLLNRNGYKSIGMDHYVLENDELYKALENAALHRNFQGYCTRKTTGQVYAFGASSISQMENAYAQTNKSVKQYTHALENGQLAVVKGYRMNSSEKIIREAINELMCNKQLIWNKVAGRLGITEDMLKAELFISREELSNFVSDGIIDHSPEGIKMTEDGMLFIRNVAASLDPLLRKVKNRYSKSV